MVFELISSFQVSLWVQLSRKTDRETQRDNLSVFELISSVPSWFSWLEDRQRHAETMLHQSSLSAHRLSLETLFELISSVQSVGQVVSEDRHRDTDSATPVPRSLRRRRC